MTPQQPHPLVHLELHTHDMDEARLFYERLLSWRTERIDVHHGSYQALTLGSSRGIDGGIVECGVQHARWLPYVEVSEIGAVTGHARRLGASVLLEPREGPAGWRSVVSTREGGEIALWQPKRRVARDPR